MNGFVYVKAGLKAASSQQNQATSEKPAVARDIACSSIAGVTGAVVMRSVNGAKEPAKRKKAVLRPFCEFYSLFKLHAFKVLQPASHCKAQRVRRGQRLDGTITPSGHLVCRASTLDRLYLRFF